MFFGLGELDVFRTGEAVDEGADGVVVVAAGEGEADELQAALRVVLKRAPLRLEYLLELGGGAVGVNLAERLERDLAGHAARQQRGAYLDGAPAGERGLFAGVGGGVAAVVDVALGHEGGDDRLGRRRIELQPLQRLAPHVRRAVFPFRALRGERVEDLFLPFRHRLRNQIPAKCTRPTCGCSTSGR